MSTWRVPKVLSAAIMMAALSGCGGHSASWKYGYDEGRDTGAELVSKGISPESACRSVARGFDPQANLNQDAYEGCLAALK
jgi:hypothetical protein